MGIKYKLKLKDLKLKYLVDYFSPVLKYFRPKKKINNYEDLKHFIKEKSAWVSQVTLYGYLKTRMGAKYVLMYEDEIFLGSINKAKWNIYSIALQDLTFFSFSYLNVYFNYLEVNNAKKIYLSILENEILNGMPNDIVEKGKKRFEERLQKMDWKTHYKSLPFNTRLAPIMWSLPLVKFLQLLRDKTPSE